MKKFHILNDLGINKNSINKKIKEELNEMSIDEAIERGLTKANELISIRTQMYSSDECECLMAWYFTSHDECVIDNQEEYNALEVYQSKQKMHRYERALKIIKSVN
jgi:hypothetical protein